MTTEIKEELLYTKEHEWVKIEGDVATVGITDFAQSSLGDIVFLELPETGANVDQDGAFGVVESIKSVSDLYAPLSGEVVEVNAELPDGPEKLNEAPYSNWLIKIKLSNADEKANLLSAKQYGEHCG